MNSSQALDELHGVLRSTSRTYSYLQLRLLTSYSPYMEQPSRALATPDLFSEPEARLQEIKALIFICGGNAIQRQANSVHLKLNQVLTAVVV